MLGARTHLVQAPVEPAEPRDADATFAYLQPGIVLPAQWDRRAAVLQPEKRLMLAVLEDAVATFLRHPRRGDARERRAVREVEEWFDATDSVWPFTFIRVCEALGLNAQYVRAGLTRARGGRSGESSSRLTRPVRRMAGARHRIGARRFA